MLSHIEPSLEKPFGKTKTYIFTKEVKRWNIEAGNYYSPQHHMYQGGTEKLLAEGVIEEEE